ncbi:MAG: T9SS type A sorting domain-containing protein [Bacteroidia bacterium]|nr:T9SS type A sorting domain-containing protein [Bacteroidia bacterium]
MKKVVYILFLGFLSSLTFSQAWEKPYYVDGIRIPQESRFAGSSYDFTSGFLLLNQPQLFNIPHPKTTLVKIDNKGDTVLIKDISIYNTNGKSMYSSGIVKNGSNYILAARGIDTVYTGVNHFCLVEIDPNGLIINKKIEKVHISMREYNVVETINKNGFFTHHSRDSVPGPSHTYKISLRRYQNLNNCLWQKSYSKNDTAVSIGVVKPTLDDGVIFNRLYVINPPYNKCILEKLDLAGNIHWSISLKNVLGYGSNPYADSGIGEIICTSDTNYIVSCAVYSTIMAPPANKFSKSYLLRFNKNGILVDSLSYTGYSIGKGVETIDNKLLFTYVIYSNNIFTSQGVLFMDNQFNLISSQAYPFQQNNFAFGVNIKANAYGGAFIAYNGDNLGSTGPNLHAVNFDSLLNPYPLVLNSEVILDNNKDCVKNTNDYLIKNSVIKLTDITNNSFYVFSNLNGTYNGSVPVGTYTVSHTLPGYKNYECPSSGTYTISTTSNTITNLNFFDTLIPNINDIKINLSSAQFVRGDTISILAFFQNIGTTNVNSVMKLNIDSCFAFVSSYPAPDSISPSILTYTISNLKPDSSIAVLIYLSVDTIQPIGSSVKLFAYSNLINDIDVSNNSDTVVSIIRSSFDPNEKTVSKDSLINESEELVYTIQFQNKGNYMAKNISIVDTLSSYLDMSTFRLLYSKHSNLKVNWYPGNRVIFKYQGINLPDSASNEPGSHGEFVYSIKPNKGCPLGSRITNRAYILFDRNPAVITGTTLNIIKQTTIGIKEIDYKILNRVTIFPNPTSSNFSIKYDGFVKKVELYDIAGHLIQSNLINGEVEEYSIEIPNLSDGLYFIKLYGSNMVYTNKLLIMR